MKPSFRKLLDQLKGQLGKPGQEAQDPIRQLLAQLSKRKLAIGLHLAHYHDALLFIIAHPANHQQRSMAEKELSRISSRLKKASATARVPLANTGLPYTSMVSSYSHDCLAWLNAQEYCSLELIGQSGFSLNEVLVHTLPALERSYTTAGYNNEELLEVLGVKKRQRLGFYLDQLNALGQSPSVKDHFFEKLALEIKVKPKSKLFSRAYNRLPAASPYYQKDWKKNFDIDRLLNRRLPRPKPMVSGEAERTIRVVKNTMALNDRETDPVTYLDPSTLRAYALARGITIILYGMVPGRQLPMESYIGFTLFRNGLPAAYGGSWVFGARATFGINIFEGFRGGESGYIMCQLLRVYRLAFGVSYFEIEPYQFGLDNPEGIASGAFWFYYKYGFRPLDKTLAAMALRESRKIKAGKSHRTPKRVLIRFTESNMALNLGSTIPVSLSAVTQKTTRMLQREFGGCRSLAVRECTGALKNKNAPTSGLNPDELTAYQELALVSQAIKKAKPVPIKRLVLMAKAKPVDPYQYQRLLLRFLNK